VELAASDGWVAAPLGGQLYLPQSWTQNRERCAQVGVPEAVPFRSKPELGLELIRQALDDGVPPAPVLGDCVYGDSPEFREGVRQLGMEFFLQVSGLHKAWTHPVTTERKRVRRYVAQGVPPAQTLAEITATFPAEQWRACSWRASDGQTRRTRLAWCEVYLQHKLREGNDDLERVWLVVDWPAGEAKPYHFVLAHFHQPPRRARCLRLSRSRWQVEQYFQRSKDDLGLDHFEGRTWRGFHHHLVLSALAYLFILTRYARTKKNFWCDLGTDTASDPALAGEEDRLLQLLRNQI
jgi:SRSO17 transposase